RASSRGPRGRGRRRGLYQPSLPLEDRRASLGRVLQTRLSSSSSLSVTKDSIIALSRAETTRPIGPSNSAAYSRCPKAQAVLRATVRVDHGLSARRPPPPARHFRASTTSLEARGRRSSLRRPSATA